MPVHHLRMLDRHHANYIKQDTVLAQLLYHLNTAHINASVSRVGTTLIHHLQMLAQRHTNDCAKARYATCTLTRLQQLLTTPSCNRTTGWFNAGPTLLARFKNKTLAQHWVNAYNSFHLYINMLFFQLSSR